MIQHGDVSLGQELTDAQGIVSWRVVLVKQPCIVLSQLAPLLATGSLIDMLVDCLTLWQKLHVDDSSRVEERDQHELDFRPRLSCFFGFGNDGHLHWRLWHLVSGSYSKIQDSSPVMTLCSKSGSVWRCSRLSWHTFTRRFFWSSSRSFGIIFAQIFRIPKSSMIIFHMLSRLISSSSAIIRTVNQRSPHTICFTRSTLSAVLLVEGLPHLRVPPWTSCATQRHVSVTLCDLRTHCTHSECIRWSFSHPDQKLQIDTLLCCHGLMSEI